VVPELPALYPSPEYVAVIVGVPAALSVYVTVHDPAKSVHGSDVNEPVNGSDVVIETVPPGLDPVTVAVHVVIPPAVNVGHETVVLVMSRNCMITLPDPVATADVSRFEGLPTVVPPEVVQPEKAYPNGGPPKIVYVAPLMNFRTVPTG
jgi:hypothetical protein